MATFKQSCSQIGSFTYAKYFTLYVELTETEESTENNTSKVNYNVYCKSSGSGSLSGATHSLYFSLGGNVLKNETKAITVSSPNANILIASGSITATHNSDGSMAIDFSASIKASSYGVSASTSGKFTLTTIARASSISCTTANIEETAIATISSASTNFRHNVIAYFGKTSVQIATNVAGGVISWTIPNSFYAQIPNAKSGVGTITCNTYNNGKLIGSKSAVLTITTNEEKCKPSVSATIADTNSATIALTGSSSKLVKYKSTAKIDITVTAKNSATIKSKKVNNIDVTGTSISIANIENNIFIVTATDSRGYSNTVTLSPTVVNYIPLTINATVKRTQPTTGEVSLTFSGNYFNGNFGSVSNSLTFKWYYRENGTSTWILGGTIKPIISNNTYSNGTTVISLGKIFNYQKMYEIYLELIDKLTTLKPTYTINKGIPIFNWGENFFNINGRLLINEKATEELVILYSNETGKQTDIALSESIVNFKSIEIFFKTKNGIYSSVKVVNPNNKSVSLILGEFIDGYTYKQYFKIVSISGTKILTQRVASWNNQWGTSNIIYNNTEDSIYITHVIGYKEV